VVKNWILYRKMARKSFGHFSASYKFILALADEPEFKKVYDQRLFDKQIKESTLELPDTFFQRFKYFKNEKEIVFIWLFYYYRIIIEFADRLKFNLKERFERNWVLRFQ